MKNDSASKSVKVNKEAGDIQSADKGNAAFMKEWGAYRKAVNTRKKMVESLKSKKQKLYE